MTPMIVVHAEREDGKKSLLAFYARNEVPLLADRIQALFRRKLGDRFISVTMTLYNPRGNPGIWSETSPPAAPVLSAGSREPASGVAPAPGSDSPQAGGQSPLAAYDVLNHPNPN